MKHETRRKDKIKAIQKANQSYAAYLAKRGMIDRKSVEAARRISK